MAELRTRRSGTVVVRLASSTLTPLPRHTWIHVTVYEEVGHGGAASVPDGVTEAISVDMGCVGNGLQCTEKQVSICHAEMGTVKDRNGMDLTEAEDIKKKWQEYTEFSSVAQSCLN